MYVSFFLLNLYFILKNFFPFGFTSKYNLHKLIYYESFNSIDIAILREKELKKWRREKKDNLVNELNPKWEDLYGTLY